MERDIAVWKDYLSTHGELTDDDIDELEDHLRITIADLEKNGLTGEEAFIIGVQRTGKLSSVAAEFSKAHGRRLWKQLFREPVDHTEAVFVAVLAIAAGLLSRLPEVFGIKLSGGDEFFYLRNLSFFVIPAIAGFFIWKYPGRTIQTIFFFTICAATAVLINTYPAYSSKSFDILIGIHVPIILWITSGFIYTGSKWNNPDRGMDFIRFSGETFIYLVLILCGGGVFVLAADLLFTAIEVDARVVLFEYVAVIGGCAAPVVAAHLAASKRNIIENMAPVLARVFSPLFLLLFIVFIVVMIATGGILAVERDILIGFDLLLALVFGMALYTISARDERSKPGFSDYLQAALIIAALIVDVIALAAILSRIGDFGFSPNKTAALGENIILCINLAVSGALYLRFFKRREGFRSLLVWQSAFLPVFAVWAAVVALLFPHVFHI